MEHIPVYYGTVKPYDTTKPPIRQPYIFTILLAVLCRFMLLFLPHKTKKINMEGLKPPYILLSSGFTFEQMTGASWVILVVVGIVHTGIAYALYFGGIRDVNAQTAAILSYLDPVLSIILSALILRERLDLFSITGAILILGSALYSELPGRKK